MAARIKIVMSVWFGKGLVNHEDTYLLITLFLPMINQ